MEVTVEKSLGKKKKRAIYRKGALLLSLALVVMVFLNWGIVSIVRKPFIFDVPNWGDLNFLETSYHYAYLHLVTLLPVLALSFDKKVRFYTRWKYLFPAIVVIGGLFIVWDVYFTDWKVWGFNENYFMGISIAGLPVEEWMFFFSVPFACTFIYECLNSYFPKDWFGSIEWWISSSLIIVLATIGIIYFDRIYTLTSCFLSVAIIFLHQGFFKSTFRSLFYRAYLISWIPFLIIDGALTGAFTEAPIVLYNPEEFSGIRIGSIPLEDSIYSFLLLNGVITLYELLRGRLKVEKRIKN